MYARHESAHRESHSWKAQQPQQKSSLTSATAPVEHTRHADLTTVALPPLTSAKAYPPADDMSMPPQQPEDKSLANIDTTMRAAESEIPANDWSKIASTMQAAEQAYSRDFKSDGVQQQQQQQQQRQRADSNSEAYPPRSGERMQGLKGYGDRDRGYGDAGAVQDDEIAVTYPPRINDQMMREMVSPVSPGFASCV
jgi:hypothetical protein